MILQRFVNPNTINIVSLRKSIGKTLFYKIIDTTLYTVHITVHTFNTALTIYVLSGIMH